MNNINFFLGANSDKGFVSYFEQLQDFSKPLQLLILKGGPGSGKSSLMKKVCAKALARGNFIEKIPCASDPESFDAFIDHTARFAMVDGTAPHITDPVLTGAADSIIYTGDLLDCGKLNKSITEIKFYSDIISSKHSAATAYIKAASALIRENEKAAKSKIKYKDIEDVANMFIYALPNGERSHKSVRLLSAISPGEVKFFSETLFSYADKIYLIDDKWGCAADALLKRILMGALASGVEVIACPCSIISGRLEHLIIPSERTAISVKNAFHNATDIATANLGGFYTPLDCEDDMLCRIEAAEELIKTATQKVKEAKELHDKLEKYYIDAMDFSKMPQIYEKITNKFYKQ